MSPVEDQGRIGSCTGCAVAGAVEYLERKFNQPVVDISRLFLYYQGRVALGTTGYDSGAMLRDVVKAASKVGAASERYWTYTTRNLRSKPSAAAYAEAQRRRITEYQRIDSLGGIKQSLADGFPVVFGFAAFSNFTSAGMSMTGVLSMPSRTDRFMGGHAVVAVGYNDVSNTIMVRNSWGGRWGQRGYFTMPYDYVSTRSLSDDFWSIRKYA